VVDRRLRGACVARVGNARAPAIPTVFEIRGSQCRGCSRTAADDRRRRRSAHRSTGEKACDRTTLRFRQFRSLPEHVARRQGSENRFRRDRGQHVARRRARSSRGRLMAGRARLLVDRGAVRGVLSEQETATEDHATEHTHCYDCFAHVMPPDERIKSRSAEERVWTFPRPSGKSRTCSSCAVEYAVLPDGPGIVNSYAQNADSCELQDDTPRH